VTGRMSKGKKGHNSMARSSRRQDGLREPEKYAGNILLGAAYVGGGSRIGVERGEVEITRGKGKNKIRHTGQRKLNLGVTFPFKGERNGGSRS